MTSVDWSFLKDVDLVQVGSFFIIFVVGIVLIYKSWPVLKKIVNAMDRFESVPAAIEEMRPAIAEIQHEVKFNNGSSVKDSVTRIEIQLTLMESRVGRIEALIQKIEEKFLTDTNEKK